jgi:CRISPR-associated protein Cas2
MRHAFYVIAYDVQSDRSRGRMATLLLAHGERVQQSLYECELLPFQREMLEHKLAQQLQDEDHLRIYTLCKQCLTQVKTYGNRPLAQLPRLWLI